jgi:hypothetical protein
LVFRDEVRVEGKPFRREGKNVLDFGFPSRDFEALAHRAVGQVGHLIDGALMEVKGRVEDVVVVNTREISCRCQGGWVVMGRGSTHQESPSRAD